MQASRIRLWSTTNTRTPLKHWEIIHPNEGREQFSVPFIYGVVSAFNSITKLTGPYYLDIQLYTGYPQNKLVYHSRLYGNDYKREMYDHLVAIKINPDLYDYSDIDMEHVYIMVTNPEGRGYDLYKFADMGDIQDFLSGFIHVCSRFGDAYTKYLYKGPFLLTDAGIQYYAPIVEL